jgi:hypothetical protein
MNIPLSALRWRYFGGGHSVAGIAIGLLLGTLFLVIGYFTRATQQEYDRDGATTTATVTGKDHHLQPGAGHKGQPRTTYTLQYRFQDEQGQTHEGGDTVELGYWNGHGKGNQVVIEYLRHHPEQSRIVEGRELAAHWGHHLLLAIGSVLAAGVFVLTLGGWIWAGRKARLVQKGEPFLGAVTEHQSRSFSLNQQKPREPSVRLLYTFTDAEGTERAGKSCWLPKDLVPRWPPGTPILVLQDPTRPTRFEADIFEARADDLARLTGEADA